MKASVLDLRYRMRAVLSALARRERVTLQHRGKLKGTIVPVGADHGARVKDHPLFGIAKGEKESVPDRMTRVRGARYRDL